MKVIKNQSETMLILVKRNNKYCFIISKINGEFVANNNFS